MTCITLYTSDHFSRMHNNESTEDSVLKKKMILFQVPIHSPWVSSPFSKMAETESVSALAAGNMLVSMVRKVLSRCLSDDFRRLISRALAVGCVAAELVGCGGVGGGVGRGVGNGCSDSLARW